MFPDDTKVYRELSNIARDNEALYNLMSKSYYPGYLNGNCALIPLNVRFYNAQRDLSLPTYSLGTILKSVKCVKDLGIMMLHKSLVHPVIEYAAPAWNPYVLARDVLALERIQRRALSACSRAKTW